MSLNYSKSTGAWVPFSSVAPIMNKPNVRRFRTFVLKNIWNPLSIGGPYVMDSSMRMKRSSKQIGQNLRGVI